MPTGGPDRLQEERHSQNLARFRTVDESIKENGAQTSRALSEISSVRHDLRNLRQVVEDFIYLCREDKKERREEMNQQAADMKEQATEIRKLSNRFIWAMGVIAGLSLAGQLILKFAH